MDTERYVILDGANRAFCFKALGYRDILVQVAPYDSGMVKLDTWQHVVSHWNADRFIEHLEALPHIQIAARHEPCALAHFLMRDGRELAVCAPAGDSLRERNSALRSVVAIYQKNAALHRTELIEPEEIWGLYPDAIALVVFPVYQPADIIAAARNGDYLPPGISRHIVDGRAIRVNFPLDTLRDDSLSLDEKNGVLLRWMQDKLAKRQIRYYAESTYQFDE
jgi:hypothetical protein